jgi:hypothetical protein
MNEPFPDADGVTEFESGRRYGVVQAVGSILKQAEELGENTITARTIRLIFIDIADKVKEDCRV